jgi:hypothetical protein
LPISPRILKINNSGSSLVFNTKEFGDNKRLRKSMNPINPAAQPLTTSPDRTVAFTGGVRSQTRNSTAFDENILITDSPSIKRVFS